MIKRLLSVGVLVTWLLSTACVRLVLRVDWGVALLCGSLIIVTGPTVIVPLLKRIQVAPRVHSILQWEGVLIDSIGVFAALLCFEWLVGGGKDRAIENFGTRTVTGLVIGAAGGFLTAWVLRTRLVPENMKNLSALACAVSSFGVTESVISEAGLLAVTLAGLIVVGNSPLA